MRRGTTAPGDRSARERVLGVLAELSRDGVVSGVSIGQIAGRVDCHPGTVKRVLREMSADGTIGRNPGCGAGKCSTYVLRGTNGF